MQKKKLTPLQIVGHVLHTAILGVLAVVMAVLLFVCPHGQCHAGLQEVVG